MRRFLVRAGLAILVLTAVLAAVGVWALRTVLADLPDVASLREYRPSLTTELWSRDGVLMAELFEERRKVVAVGAVPEHVVRAFLAAEDSQFFEHEGLDLPGILRAAWANLKERRVVQGGSTITQQVAKSLLLSPERSFRRKIREAVLAIRIEQNLSKPEILYLYLNQIYLGHGAYGVESASEIYFDISAKELSLAQAALLAGLPQAPSRYDPYQHPNRALDRRAYVLSRMADQGWISAQEARQAAEEPLSLGGAGNPYGSLSPYYSEHVRRLAEDWHGRETVLREGLKIVTAMDSGLQSAAREALRQGLEDLDRRQGYRGPLDRVDPDAAAADGEEEPLKPGQRRPAVVIAVSKEELTVRVGVAAVPMPRENLAWALGRNQEVGAVFRPGDVVLCEFQSGGEGGLEARLVQEPEVEGALVCLDPRTGEVLACVGGYSFLRSQFNRAIQAQRQPGSAIKPLIYAAAIAKGFTPGTLVYDTPIVYDSEDLEEKWKPKNYSDRFYGATTLREALVNSRNVVTIKVLRDIGIPYAVQFLKRLGIQSPISADLSLALGASSVNLLELSSLYGVFPAGGVHRRPIFVLRIEDRDGEVLEEYGPSPGVQVLEPETAFILTHMMEAVIREGTGRRARGLDHPAAGKTGTTNNNRDAWFLGFTPQIVTGVWVGYDDGRTLGRRETGGRAAAPIWLDFMKTAVRNRPLEQFTIPDGVEFARIDAETGLLAGPNSEQTFTAAFLRGSTPEPEKRELVPATARPLDPMDPGSMDALR